MWTYIKIENLKGYKETDDLALRPFTVLIGPNGGGKSTLLQFLMVLKQTAANNLDTSTTLITNVKRDKIGETGYINLGLYKDYVYMGDTKLKVGFTLGWNALSKSHTASAIKVQLENKRPSNQVFVKELSYYKEFPFAETPSNILARLERKAGAAYSFQVLKQTIDENKLKEQSREYEPQKFYRFSPKMLDDVSTETEAHLREYVSDFESCLDNTFYLGPLREHPRPYYEITGGRPNHLGIDGAEMGAVLYVDDVESNGNLIQRVSTWLARLDIAESVSLSRIKNGNIFNLNIRGKNQSRDVNLAAFGFGASQILPVIVESLYAPAGATVLIEQPEIHLNAHHQLELPDFFAEIINDGTDKQFIIETHSEYFLKRISTLVAKDRLSCDDVIVYYCSSDENGSHIQPITLDSDGRYSWWPEDFLAEGYEGTIEHMNAMQSKVA